MVAAMGTRPTDGLKRESGENPEQNPLLYFPLFISELSFKNKPLGHWAWEGRTTYGKSQKTYRDIDLDFGFRGIRAETHC